ncbi:MAG: transposase, partial [Verrucomicrobiota bacterium]
MRPTVQRQTRYEWDYLYGAREVLEGRAGFLHLPTVDLDCNTLFWQHLRSSDPGAEHVVIADQAGFHLRPGDPRLPEGVHVISLPPYSPELNPCEHMRKVLKPVRFNEGGTLDLPAFSKPLREDGFDGMAV